MVVLPISESEGRTFGELQTAALGDSFDRAKYATRVKAWLNEALGRVVRSSSLVLEQQAVDLPIRAGVTTYLLPAQTLRVLGVAHVDDGCELEVAQYDELLSPSNATGRPWRYAVSGTSLLLTPVPATAETLRVFVRSRPVRMQEDGDRAGLPEDWDDLLVTYATARLYRAEDDKDMHDALMTDFANDLARMKVDLQEMVDNEPRQIPGCW